MKVTTTLVLTLILPTLHGKVSILPDKPPTKSAEGECIIQIFQDYFALAKKIAIYSYSGDNNMLSIIAQNVDVPITLNAPEIPKIGLETRAIPDLVLALEAPQNISGFLKTILWVKETRFMVSLGKRENNDAVLREIFKQFWKNLVVNVLVMAPENEKDVIIYGYRPYAKTNCQDVDIFTVGRWINGTFENLGKELKEGLKLENINQCRVNITVVNMTPHIIYPYSFNCTTSSYVDGVEGKILMELPKKLNFQPLFRTTCDEVAWGWRTPVPRGGIGDLYNGTSEISGGLFATNMERYNHFDASKNIDGMECITFGLPEGTKLIQGKIFRVLVSEFTNTLWYFTLSTLIITSLFLWGVNRLCYQEDSNSSLVGNTLYIFAVCLNVPSKLPNRGTLRIICISMVWFSFIMVVAYQASMLSRLTVPIKDKNIETIKELSKTNLNIGGDVQFTKGMDDPDARDDFRNLKGRFITYNMTTDEAVEEIRLKGNLALLRHSTNFMYAFMKYKETTTVIMLKDCVYNYFPTFLLRKRSPFTNHLNNLISRLQDGGFLSKWRKDYIYRLKRPKPLEKPLSLKNLRAIFLVLGVSYSIAFSIFVLEVLTYYLKNSIPLW